MPCDGPSSPVSFRPVRGAGTDVKEKRTYVRTPRYAKGETISDGRQWGFKWRPQWYQLHAGIEFNWIEGTTRGERESPPLSLSRPTFCNVVVDFSSRGSQATFVLRSDIDIILDIIASQVYKRNNNLMHFRCKIHVYRIHQLQFPNHTKYKWRVNFHWMLFEINRGKSKIETSISRQHIQLRTRLITSQTV